MTASASGPTAVVFLGEAFALGMVDGEIRGRGATSGDSVILTVRRVEGEEIIVTIPRGSLLRNSVAEEPDMVVYRLREILSPTGKGPYTDRVTLADDMWHEYTLEAYSLEAGDGIASVNSTFLVAEPLPSEVLQVLDVVGKISTVTPKAIQTAIWSITDGLNTDDMAIRGYVPDLQTMRVLFETAGLDPSKKRLFDETRFQQPQGYVARGNTYYREGEYAQAIADYDQAISVTAGGKLTQ